MINFLFEATTTFLENYIYFSAICLIFRKNDKLGIKLLISSIQTVVILYLNSYSYFSYFTMLILALLWTIIPAVVYKVKMWHAISFTLSFMLILVIQESIVLVTMGVITGRSDYVNVITQTGTERLTFLFWDKLVFVCIYLLVKAWKKKVTGFSERKSLLVISIGGMCGAVYLIEQQTRQVNIDIAVSWVFLLIIVALMLVVGYYYMERRRERDSVEFTKMRNELLESNYNDLKDLYETNSMLFHDFKNHIMVIKELVDENNLEELKKYISGFELKDRQGVDTFWTEDKVVNFILNNKINAAKQVGIHINANIDYPVRSNINSNDMTTILANLFDNAIESCDRIPNGGVRKIDLTIRRINEMLIIKMENSCNEKPILEDNTFITLKANKSFHGWGLRSVKSAAEKYGGLLKCSYDQERQIFRAVLSMTFRGCQGVR